jgi:hypothetical protein
MAPEMKDKLKKHYEATGRMLEADDLEPQPSKSYIKEINPEEKLSKEGKKAAAKEVNSMKDLGKKKQYKGMYAKGGSVKSSASKRADGCAVRGKTKGRMI